MPPLHFRTLLGPAGASRRQFHRGRGCVATIVPIASTSRPLTDTVPASIRMIHSFLSVTPSRSFPLQALFTITCRPDFAFQQRFHTCNQCSQSVPNLLLRTLEGFTEKSMVRTLAFVPYGLADAASGSDFRTVGGSFYKDNDIATAQALLAQAGYPNGKGFPTFKLEFNTSDLHKSIAEAIQQMWKKNLGITCTIGNKERGVYLQDQQQLNYDVERYGWIADYQDPMTFLDMFVTNGGNNNTGWSNKTYDALIAKAKATVDPKARMATLHAAEKIIMTDLPILPIYYYTNPVLLSKHIKNFYESPMSFIDWKNAYMG